MEALLVRSVSANAEVRRNAESELRQMLSRGGAVLESLFALVEDDDRAVEVRILAAILLRSVVGNIWNDAPALIHRLLQGDLWNGNPRLIASVANLVAALIVCGSKPDLHAKIDALLTYVRNHLAEDKGVDLLKCVKVTVVTLAMECTEVDESFIGRFDEGLLRYLPQVHLPSKGAHHVVGVMRRLAESGRFHETPRTPTRWIEDGYKICQNSTCTMARNEALLLIRCILNGRPELNEDQIRICVVFAQYGVEIDVVDGYDSDDGSPVGNRLMRSCALDVLSKLVSDGNWPGNFLEVLEKGIAGISLEKSHEELFERDWNEYIALHEDESSVNEPRHAGVELIVLLHSANSQELFSCLKRLDLSERPLDRLFESLLWIVGNLCLELQEDTSSCESLFNIFGSMLSRLLRQRLDDPILLATLFWALSVFHKFDPRPLQDSSEVDLVINNLRSACPAVAIYASRVLAHLVKIQDAIPAAKSVGCFRCLLQIIEFCNSDTIHIPLEALDALCSSNSTNEKLSAEDKRAALSLLVDSWERAGLRYDDFVHSSVISVSSFLVGKSLELARDVFLQCPSLFECMSSHGMNPDVVEQVLLNAGELDFNNDGFGSCLVSCAKCLASTNLRLAIKILTVVNEVDQHYCLAVRACLQEAGKMARADVFGSIGKLLLARIDAEVSIASLEEQVCANCIEFNSIDWANGFLSRIIGKASSSLFKDAVACHWFLATKDVPSQELQNLTRRLEKLLDDEEDLVENDDFWAFARDSEMSVIERSNSDDFSPEFSSEHEKQRVTASARRFIVEKLNEIKQTTGS